MGVPVSFLFLLVLRELFEEPLKVVVPKLVDVSGFEVCVLLLLVLQLLLEGGNLLLGQTPERHRQQVVIVLGADLTDSDSLISGFVSLTAVLFRVRDDRGLLDRCKDLFDLRHGCVTFLLQLGEYDGALDLVHN